MSIENGGDPNLSDYMWMGIAIIGTGVTGLAGLACAAVVFFTIMLGLTWVGDNFFTHDKPNTCVMTGHGNIVCGEELKY